MALELKVTDHNYYCSDSRYTSCNDGERGYREYPTWEDFKDEWLDADMDYNHIFRFDINEYEEVEGLFSLHLYYILQRKGIFLPVIIEKITKEDIPEIEAFLYPRWEYIKGLWTEFSTDEKELTK